MRQMRLSIQNPEYEIAELRARVEKLEEHVYKKKRTPTTLGQQILLLNILGILDSFYSLPMTNLMRQSFCQGYLIPTRVIQRKL